jgi:hypothetical protein
MGDNRAPRVTRLPLLIGILVDVSSSMAEQIGNSGELKETRLEAIRGSLDDLAERFRHYCAEVGEDPRTLLNIFAYGFGFGNLLTKFRGLDVPGVQSLLTPGHEDPVLTGQDLLDKWTWIKSYVGELSRDMFGATPMVAAFSKAEETVAVLRQKKAYRDPPILLVVSDGLPTDPKSAGAELVLACADRMRDAGIVIVSCFVASQDLTLHRTLYEAPMPNWGGGARLMFDCASPFSDFPDVVSELEDHGWEIPAGARLFAQVNQSELLSEFVAAVVPSKSQGGPDETATKREQRNDIRVFVSYSHADSKYVGQRDSLLSYVRALEREGVSFWCDRSINAGDFWDEEIKRRIEEAEIALILVSQSFLNSEYCRNVEAQALVAARKKNGLRIVPVLVSACDWKSVDWLAQTQIMPSDGRNVEQHMTRRGQRMAFYLDVLNELRANTKVVRDRRSQ